MTTAAAKQKSILRQEARRHRARFDPGSEEADHVTALFFDHIKPKHSDIVAAYWPKGREFDPRSILEKLLGQNIICALPIVQKDTHVLKFAQWDEGIPLKKGSYGIYEPDVSANVVDVIPDILIVPLLAFDRQGYRLGQGGGHYDASIRYLKKQKDIQTVGVGYAAQSCLFPLPKEEHDEKLDWIITPQDALNFNEE